MNLGARALCPKVEPPLFLSSCSPVFFLSVFPFLSLLFLSFPVNPGLRGVVSFSAGSRVEAPAASAFFAHFSSQNTSDGNSFRSFHACASQACSGKGPHARSGSSPEILGLGGIAPSAPSSPSPLSPFSETEKYELHIGLHLKSVISTRVANSVVG